MIRGVGLAGDEFYIREWPELTGKSFQEVLLSFPSALPVGVKIQATGEVKLNPDDSYTMADGVQNCACCACCGS